MAKLLLGSVVGPQGPQGTAGADGAQGPQGIAGPSEITAATDVVGLTPGRLLYNKSGKVGSVDIVDNLLSIDPDKPLSANQGKVLKSLIDDNSSAIGQIEQDIQDLSTLANGKATTQALLATITTTWTGTEAPYTQTIAVTGIQALDNPIVDIDLSSISVYADQQAVLTDWAKIYRISTQSNHITIYATEKTMVVIPIQLKVVR